jgi:hypothetical protein
MRREHGHDIRTVQEFLGHRDDDLPPRPRIRHPRCPQSARRDVAGIPPPRKISHRFAIVARAMRHAATMQHPALHVVPALVPHAMHRLRRIARHVPSRRGRPLRAGPYYVDQATYKLGGRRTPLCRYVPIRVRVYRRMDHLRSLLEERLVLILLRGLERGRRNQVGR